MASSLEAMGKTVLCAASTGPAAIRLSQQSQTVHSAFSIPPRGQFYALHPGNLTFQRILATDVFIIDEYSMLTSKVFNLLMFRIRNVCACASVDPSSKLIIYIWGSSTIIISLLPQSRGACHV
jgi:hypothetical protein